MGAHIMSKSGRFQNLSNNTSNIKVNLMQLRKYPKKEGVTLHHHNEF
jgi:hypothetical protein